MKVWPSLLLATVFVFVGVSTDYSDEGPLPCNGFPQYRKIPINQAFYLGAHDATTSQTKDIGTMLADGIRFLDIRSCKDHQGNIVICGSTQQLTQVLESVFQFARDTVEQFLIIHIRSENQDVGTKELEQLIDARCKVHTEKTAGTDEFKKTECPFVHTHIPGKDRWPSMGEVVNYDPDMAQWVGDGELVGVRTKFLVTLDPNVLQTPGYKTSYFSPTFWRSTKHNSSLQEVLNTLCKVPAGGIGLEAYGNGVDFLENVLTSKSGCNLNDSPLNSFFSFISVDHYDEKKLSYLKELEGRMMELNYEKWSGNYKPISPSLYNNKHHVAERDEL